MTINLPPRRELPVDVKQRMRPDFTQVARRNHTPLAVAAGVILLIAGGVAVTRSDTENPLDPARARIVTPSGHDLARCRAALNDEGWSSTEMVVIGGRKVLVNKDNRFCELSRSRAYVAAPDAIGVRLEAGTVTYRSEQIIAGIPPLGARTARARQSNGTFSRGSTDAVVTPDFFVIHAAAPLNVTELVFDDRTVPVPVDAQFPVAKGTDSFESGDGDPWTPVNVLARCADSAAVADAMPPEDLESWQPLLTIGLEHRSGLLLAHRAGKEWATCFVAGAGGDPGPLRKLHDVPTEPANGRILGAYDNGDEFVIAARTLRAATTVDVSTGGGRSLTARTAEVTDGFFAVKLPRRTDNVTTFPTGLWIVARNAEKEIVYEGALG
jgi:hypothetical protein